MGFRGKSITKRIISVFAMTVFLVSALAGCGVDNDFSKKDVTCIVSFAEGGGTDKVMRALAEAAAPSFKSIKVENQTGSSGIIGMKNGAAAKADGTTITMIVAELCTLEAAGKNEGLSYEDFKPILMVNSGYACVAVRADDDRFDTIEEFVSYGKKEELTEGNSGQASIWHFASLVFAEETGVKLSHKSYNGSVEAVEDMIAGKVDCTFVSYAEVSNYVQEGKVKVLATCTDTRLDASPKTPTCVESGYDVTIGTWRGIAVPKDTPDEIVTTLYSIFAQALTKESFVNYMNENNLVIEILDSESFSTRIKSDLERFRNVSGELN